MCNRRPVIPWLIVFSVLLLAGCGHSNNGYHAGSGVIKAGQDDLLLRASQHDFESLLNSVQNNDVSGTKTANPSHRLAASGEIKSRILQQYGRWKGVRYQLGGDSQRGIDCSAFVRRTFLEQFGLELPRSTAGQKVLGEHITRDKLRTGDLVLFKTGSAGGHIGIYIGNNQFVHASTRKGVIISSLDNPYWKPRYRGARRILSHG